MENSHNYRIILFDHQDHQVQPVVDPHLNQLAQTRALSVTSSYSLDTCSDEDFPTSLVSPFQRLTAPSLKTFFLMSNLNLT